MENLAVVTRASGPLFFRGPEDRATLPRHYPFIISTLF